MLKRTAADIWFSKCVRMRTNWVCEYCSGNFSHEESYLHCSHFVTRAKCSVRYHPKNAFAHCQACHKKLGGDRWGGGNVAEFAHHYDQIHSPIDREVIRILSGYSFPKHKHHIKTIAAHYREQYRRMEDMRSCGEDGRIELENYAGSLELNALIEDIRSRL